MLPRDHRLTASRDFGAVMRRGARAGGSAVVVTVLFRQTEPDTERDAEPAPWRGGLIVSKAVGNAVVRHRTQRRLRHILAELMAEPGLIPEGVGVDVVVRALQQVPETSHEELLGEVRSGIRRAVKKARRHLERTDA
ncbi:ribonuclease P protein component [Nesterenkonia cremea]|uniref:Ribonuclease P protein component n=1 Tax=Nesterenkonia cremea TaxID=1882340 RepID=A0A917AKB4_9MICC|nr:ribonuclease P protein component [Nesterenkonia cremea]GGE57873.1 ribonuclease P protein component [Nesterenkonia cremea]